jgi:hypothetical protein
VKLFGLATERKVRTEDWGEADDPVSGKEHVSSDWPKGVKPISFDAIGRLGFSEHDGQLYWDGRKVQTETKLGWFERGLAVAVAASSIVIALIEAARFSGFGAG